KMPAFEWVHVQLHQQKGMISLSPPTICNSAASGTRGASIVKIVCGLLLMFDTQTLDALQSTLNIHW
ncbi:hypothetical protein ACH6XM_27085, partial [Klebsiella pneumoniae]|nr:hypothetical protein [Klebsiella pneumoniae]